ncbi:MAG TPA: polysaccharide deacetylase family protein [Blastocatellia bacterium]|nr:polysaccharide deacetylase family protein [Blastocatellia bacterium]
MIKQASLNLLRVSGAFDLMRLARRRHALILTYHRFSPGGEGANGGAAEKTPAKIFAAQLEYLTKHYNVVPLSRLAESIGSRGQPPPRLAAITIDDGYRDAYEIAYPLLRRFGAPATLFVPSDFIDGRAWIWTDKARFLTRRAVSQRLAIKIGGQELRLDLDNPSSRRAAAERVNATLKRLPEEIKEEAIERLARALGVALPQKAPDEFGPIAWAEAREMQANGIEIGSHTLTHPILTRVGDERLRLELQESRSRLEEVLRRRIEQFCYPNGDYDERVRSEVARAGYSVAVTCAGGLNKRGDDPLALRRIHAERDNAHFAQSVSGFEELKNRARRWSRIEDRG